MEAGKRGECEQGQEGFHGVSFAFSRSGESATGSLKFHADQPRWAFAAIVSLQRSEGAGRRVATVDDQPVGTLAGGDDEFFATRHEAKGARRLLGWSLSECGQFARVGVHREDCQTVVATI